MLQSSCMQIAWTGISAQRDRRGKKVAPLSSATPTGQVVDRIASKCPAGVNHRKLNFLDRVLLDEAGKLRPPHQSELDANIEPFVKAMKASRSSIFVFLGSHIRSAFQAMHPERSFENNTVYHLNGMQLLFIHHPSYVRIYRSRMLNEYISEVAETIASAVSGELLLVQ
jgi:uracil DNA glycosylase superfamily protein